MTFQESIKICFSKYADFSGRASLSEYWWFVLFLLLGAIVANLLGSTVGLIFSLATLVPALAAATRRLHDTHRSGWWLLIGLVPLLGQIILIVFLVQASRE